jgi:hypothetical protein
MEPRTCPTCGRKRAARFYELAIGPCMTCTTKQERHRAIGRRKNRLYRQRHPTALKAYQPT